MKKKENAIKKGVRIPWNPLEDRWNLQISREIRYLIDNSEPTAFHLSHSRRNTPVVRLIPYENRMESLQNEKIRILLEGRNIIFALSRLCFLFLILSFQFEKKKKKEIFNRRFILHNHRNATKEALRKAENALTPGERFCWRQGTL